MAEIGRKDELKKLDIKSELESLTIHGIPRIVSSQSVTLKLIWSCSCMFASTVLIYCSALSIGRHLSREVYMNAERVLKESVALPAVTFCKANSLDRHPTSEANYSYPEMQALPDNCSFIDRKLFKKDINQEHFIQACQWFFANHSFGEMGNIARVGQYHVEALEFPKHFSFVPNIWPCFSLNPSRKFRQHGVGEKAGIRMFLYSDESDYKRKMLDPLDDDSQGLFLAIHDRREHMNGHSKISLPAGFHTSIEITKITIKRKPAPFPSNCAEIGEENGDNIFPGKETIDSCRLSCFHKVVHQKCGGIYPPMRTFMKQEKYPGFIDISERKSAQCFHKAVNYMKDCKCRVPCEMETYETKVTRTPWPQELIADQMYDFLYKGNSQNKTERNSKIQKLLKVSIYYRSLSEFKYIEEEKYDKISIFSDLGGQVGLLIGASFLSFVEIVILLTNYIIYIVKTMKNRFH